MNPDLVAELFGYHGRRCVVTGSSSGIGAATVRLLRALGGTVTGLDVAEPSHVLPDHFSAVDLGDRTAIDDAAAGLGHVDALFNCAGIAGAHPIERVVRVNFLGLRHLTQQISAQMSSGAAVVSVASVAGASWRRRLQLVQEMSALSDWDAVDSWCEAHPELFVGGAYRWSKECVIADHQARSVDLARRGVRLNTVSPGQTATPLLERTVAFRGQAAVDAFPRPLGRDATADEQAFVLAFANSSAASYLVGADVVVDGGFLAGVATGRLDDPLGL